jgi:hypothetical protein
LKSFTERYSEQRPGQEGWHDRANRLRIAQDPSGRYGWPLHVIENCADDPPRDQPLVFLEALGMTLGTEKRQQVTA